MLETVIYTIIVIILIFIIHLGLRAAFIGIKVKKQTKYSKRSVKKKEI